ncbi:Modification methylase MboII, partial [Haemophilus influenzae]
MADKAPKK